VPPPVTLTPALLRQTLENKRSNKDALPTQIRTLFGADELKTGAKPKATTIQEGLVVAWAIEALGLKKDEAPQVVTDDPAVPSVKLQRVGKSDIFAGTVLLPQGMAGRWRYEWAARLARRASTRTILPIPRRRYSRAFPPAS
jgi:hypothetical protein